MKPIIPDAMREARGFRYLCYLLGVVLLGAIGSGCWELLLLPFLQWLSNATLSIWATIFSGYVEVLYKGVARDPKLMLLLEPVIFLTVILVVVPWTMLFWAVRLKSHLNTLQMRGEEEKVPIEDVNDSITQRITNITGKYKFLVIATVLLGIFSTIVYPEQYFRILHSINAASFLQRSIDIVAPSVGPSETVSLRAQFSSIDSAADFYALEDRLRNIADENSIELPEFKSIR
jgi:hypothetical protein